MTYHEEIGVSIVIHSSLAEGTNIVATLDNNISNYSHSLSANGGFDKMSVTISDDRISLDDWIERGLARHIVVYNFGGEICWEGFVNSVNAQLGGQQITIGPLMEIGNRVSVSYSPVDNTVSPPTSGETTSTLIVENEVSQSRYGIIETVLSGGRVTDTEAELIRDTFLIERAFPGTSSTISVGQSSSPTVTLECLGYWYWANAYVFNESDTGTIWVHDRIIDILEANPNTGMYGTIIADDNLSLITKESVENKIAMAHLKELLALGGANDQRYTLGFYENRTAYYKEIPTTPAYRTEMSDQGQRILTYNGAIVYPWDVRPAQWLFVSDSLIGRYTDTTNYYEDPRYMFIEKVDYSIPWGLTLSGSRVGTYDQLLAKMGLGDF